MFDLVYYGTEFGNPFILRHDWPEGIRKQWLEALKNFTPVELFVPKFREAHGSAPGWGTWNLNKYYFPTLETAQWIANKFGDGTITEVPFGGSGGIFQADQNEYLMRTKSGKIINAGILASYYERNPPDKFPGLAEKLIWSVIN